MCIIVAVIKMENYKNSYNFDSQILQAVNFSYNYKDIPCRRITKDYELDFVIDGNRIIKINGNKYFPISGSVILRRPGDIAESVGTYTIKALTLDFQNNQKTQPTPYDRENIGNIQIAYNNPLLDLIPECFQVSNFNNLIKIFDLIYTLYRNPKQKEYCNILLNKLFFSIITEVYHQKSIPFASSYEENAVDKVCNYIHENINDDLSLKALAQFANISPNYLIKLFKKELKTTPQEYIIKERLNLSKILISETNLKIKDIATQCGFNDSSYFTQVFKTYFNLTPVEYRVIINKG